ncbi:Hypothetical protein NTJ_03826 [Nesidiocoris tenuis]|uniref:Uncharacterized protein n=1 Tax=Nesidiocoris tenuis TaxID=355587 RepID=A0ABN7AFH3_9HEMI|nr:Hypothetical protein NTJ_03826 [Nesidiocoris tenuis]
MHRREECGESALLGGDSVLLPPSGPRLDTMSPDFQLTSSPLPLGYDSRLKQNKLKGRFGVQWYNNR